MASYLFRLQFLPKSSTQKGVPSEGTERERERARDSERERERGRERERKKERIGPSGLTKRLKDGKSRKWPKL